MKRLLPALLTNLVFLAILLGCAGRLDYWPAWLYVGTGVLLAVLTRLVLRKDPELAKEREQPGPGAKGWDRKLLGLGLLLQLAMLVVAGLDAGRDHWDPQLTWPWAVAGLVASLVGSGLFLLALKENRFFSAVVRIQGERGHTVCTSGPYRVVRHPGNAGMILGTLGLPLLLMSAWSAIPAVLSAAVMVARTCREDADLERELDGYPEYQRATRYRLVPGLW
jgi:protein-S-isoprenylcysteine O-methyltransferase Ste14